MKIPVGAKVTIWYVNRNVTDLDDFLNSHQILKIKTFKKNDTAVMIIAYRDDKK